METNIFQPRKLEKKEILLPFLCLLIGFALRFYTFDQKSLWLDEIHTYNDSRVELADQIRFYKENPTYLHSPLFFVLTHFFYPFTQPERDLRIIPLIFGTLSIPMIYLLARQFSASIAFPCSLGLTFMTYHISLSQEGRFYSMLLFFGIAGLYFFMEYLKCLKRRYLFLVAFCFAVMFYTSYSSILFITFSQLLWFYRIKGGSRSHLIPSFLFLNGLILLFCLPWILFLVSNYKGQPFITESLRTLDLGSLWNTFYGVLHDWVPNAPLIIISAILLILFPFFSTDRKNAITLLAIILLPIGGLYLYCKLNKITHFITSRYFISFFPLLVVIIFLSLNAIEDRLERLRILVRLDLLFAILLIASNLIILPLYYQSEKQDFRRLATYLKGNIQDGDKVIVGSIGYIAGLLHYLGVIPQGRHYLLATLRVSDEEVEYKNSLIIQNKRFIISYSNTYWIQYALEGNRLWIVVDKETAQKVKNLPFCVPKGDFDGSFLNFDRFPTDASMYLFLLDPKSSVQKGIDRPTR
jgi:hypothetical protein